MDQNSVGPKERTEKVVWIVPPEGAAEQPGWREWREGREQLVKDQQWESQWQEFLGGLESPHTGWGKEPSPWEDAKAFLSSFEQVAQACQWPREEWVARLLPALNGESQRAFGSLEARDREDYGKVKVAILRGEANRMEMLRQDFRQFRSQEMEDPRQIYSRLQELCCQWLRPERHSKEQILELLILEQFLAILPLELQSWIRAKGPENCTQATAFVEDFLLSQQGGPTTRKWQVVHQDAEEALLDPAETQSNKEVEQVEISLPGNGTQWCHHSSSLLPPEGQERPEAEQIKVMGAFCSSQAVTNLEEMSATFHRVEKSQTQDHNQKTMFWQVLPETSGEVESLEGLLVPRDDLPFNVQKEEEILVQFPEERRSFLGQGSGDGKESQLEVGEPSSGQNKSGDPEVTKVDMLVTAEFHKERRESKWELRKKSLQGQNESQDLSEGLSAACDQTHPEHPRKEKPLFSRYGRRYRLSSGLVTELTTRDDHDECSTSDSSSDLDEHQRNSTGEKSYKCSKHWEHFPKEINLMRQQSRHTGEKKYDLPECGESITSKSLMRHVKIHCRQKAYKCPLCGKFIKRKPDLDRHLRIHTGEKPFKCPVCGKSFSRTDDLSKHQSSHGGKISYECSQCGKTFRHLTFMLKHQKIHKGY
ncbi:zinc finger protein 397-like [Eublepharis macularius]|uniref:Zinc finger protein 397-like n=1 Tax=Eublepharis macularius TaxID=481883 RepID=A0AA97J7I2_EUBMA|nr:zinc finger protein 397-like [Eublepharis macularius]